MKFLLLTPNPHLLHPTLTRYGDNFVSSMATPDIWPQDIDFIVSFGYRHIIKEPHLTIYKRRIINVHIAMLPWNRGADPNFWSWFDNTPKGVSIHFIDDDSIDNGAIITQMQISKWKEKETLKTSYEFLLLCARKLFEAEWGNIRTGNYNTYLWRSATEDGSYHKQSEKERWMNNLPLKWDTPVKDVETLGAAMRMAAK